MKATVPHVFAEVLGIPAGSVHDATSPENTPEWDSLQSMNLVTALEETFLVRFSTREMLSMRTVGQVREVLRSKGVDHG